MISGRSARACSGVVSTGEPQSRISRVPASRSVRACASASSRSTAPSGPSPTWQCASTRPGHDPAAVDQRLGARDRLVGEPARRRRPTARRSRSAGQHHPAQPVHRRHLPFGNFSLRRVEAGRQLVEARRAARAATAAARTGRACRAGRPAGRGRRAARAAALALALLALAALGLPAGGAAAGRSRTGRPSASSSCGPRRTG